MLLILFARSEIFEPDNVKESDLNSSDKGDYSGDGQEDPFLMETDKEAQDEAANLTNAEDNTTEGDRMNLVENINSADLFGSKDDKSKDSEIESKSSKDKSKKKKGKPFWAEVMIDNKKKNVLVNVKKVTIIESVAPGTVKPILKQESETDKAVSPKAQRKDSSTPSPYIKVQMPTSYPGKTGEAEADKKESKTPHKRRKRSESSGKSKKSKSEDATTTTQSTKSAESTTANSKSSKDVVPTTGIKKTKDTDKSSKPETTKSTKSDPFGGISKPETSKSPESTTPQSSKEERSKNASAGTIFDVLKNMPSGGKESDSLFVEGTFKFPKRKEISSKVFKLSGYISS